MTARKRVAITGLGLVTPVGNDVATTWDAVLHGRSGGAPISVFDASGFPVHIAAEVKNFDAAVSYHGWADVGGRRVIELNHCLGPMLPVEDFDAPEALRERFALLRGAGAAPDRFHGVVAPDAVTVEHVAGQSVRANLDVPTSATFFADHFPRRPVFPATLLLNAQIALAARVAREARGGNGAAEPVPVRMTHVKMRAFIVPGQRVDARAEFAGIQDGMIRISLSARDGDGKTIATSRVEFAATAA